MPDNYERGRADAHRLAYSVVAEARRRATGRFGLRWTEGGFGTPLFDNDRRVRVDGMDLVLEDGSIGRRETVTTLAAAARFVGVSPSTEAAESDSPELGDPSRALDIDAGTIAFLDAWFGFAWTLLETLLDAESAEDAGEIQLWPGHFDAAVEIGDADAGQRATYGASPGDQSSPEPYLYVAAWSEIDQQNSFWNATAFNGAILPYAELFAPSGDPRDSALEFFSTGLDLLMSTETSPDGA